MFDVLVELLIQLAIDVIGQILVEGLFELGFEPLIEAVRPARESRPVVAAIGHVFLGALAGALSLLIVPHRLVRQSRVPGLSLLVAPLGNGVVMHAIGRRWDHRPQDRPALFTFWAGVLFALALAAIRFVWIR